LPHCQQSLPILLLFLVLVAVVTQGEESGDSTKSIGHRCVKQMVFAILWQSPGKLIVIWYPIPRPMDPL
jgi:hypothetical protein